MSKFTASATRLVDAGFDHFGDAGVYTPPGGEAVNVMLVPAQADDVSEFGRASAVQKKHVFEVRASDVADPEAGGVFQITATGETLRIQSKPIAKDEHRLVWVCDCSPI